jgi:hypothetical protein
MKNGVDVMLPSGHFLFLKERARTAVTAWFWLAVTNWPGTRRNERVVNPQR